MTFISLTPNERLPRTGCVGVASQFVSDADYVKKFAVTRSDLLAAWGMGLIIAGVAFFLIRDLRQRFEQIDILFDRLEARFRYVPFIAPTSALLGVFLLLLALVF